MAASQLLAATSTAPNRANKVPKRASKGANKSKFEARMCLSEGITALFAV